MQKSFIVRGAPSVIQTAKALSLSPVVAIARPEGCSARVAVVTGPPPTTHPVCHSASQRVTIVAQGLNDATIAPPGSVSPIPRLIKSGTIPNVPKL